MTNRELLQAPESALSGLDRQRRYLLRVESTPSPCPACRTPVNVFAAAGIDLDAYDFGATLLAYRCPSCRAELDQVVPFFPAPHPWLWVLKPAWLREQLRKAAASDDQKQRPEHTDPE